MKNWIANRFTFDRHSAQDMQGPRRLVKTARSEKKSMNRESIAAHFALNARALITFHVGEVQIAYFEASWHISFKDATVNPKPQSPFLSNVFEGL